MKKGAFLVLATVAALAAGSAFGQVSIDSINAAAQGDKGLSMLSRIFGNLALGTSATSSNSTIGEMFGYFCAAMMAVGIAWFTFTIGSGVVQTAHDGKFLGKRYSSVWLPIRFAIGVSLLIPAFGGYSLAHVAVLTAAKWGVGIANSVQTIGLRSMGSGGSFGTPASATPYAAAEKAFASLVCVAARSEQMRASGSPEFAAHWRTYYVADGAAAFGYRDGTECGTLSIKLPSQEATMSDSTAKRLATTQRRAFDELLTGAQTQATDWINAVWAFEYKGIGNDYPPVPRAALAQLAERYQATVAAAAASAARESGRKESQILAKIEKAGWTELGAWYQQLATASAKLSSAAAITIEGKGPELAANVGGVDLWRDAAALLKKSNTNTGATADGGAAKVDFETDGPGAWIASKSIALINWGGKIDGADGQQTNPLLLAKNLGDSVVIASETAIATYIATKSASHIADGVPVLGGIGKAIGEAANVLGLAGAALFGLGWLLSVYLPFAPYMLWFVAVVGWLVHVAKAMAAAPVWALLHLDGEGDGMGRHTTPGYTMLLEVLIRPPLLVLGFFLAHGVMLAGADLLNAGFFDALRSMATDGSAAGSVVGPFSIIGAIAMYVILMIGLVHTAFGLATSALPEYVASLLPQSGGASSTSASSKTA